MKALTGVARAICYALAHAIDMTHVSEGDAAVHWKERANLLTPIAKAFATDTGVAVSSLGIQVHGGMGFIEETGAASLYRDARIAPIYEGTNGIQAIDLVTRKLPQAGGQHVLGYHRRARRKCRGDPHLQSRRLRARRRGDRQGDRRPARIDALPAGSARRRPCRTGAGRRDPLSAPVLADGRRRLPRKGGVSPTLRAIGSRSAASIATICLAKRLP